MPSEWGPGGAPVAVATLPTASVALKGLVYYRTTDATFWHVDAAGTGWDAFETGALADHLHAGVAGDGGALTAYEAAGAAASAVTAHNNATTGVHGVGAGTVAKVGDIPTSYSSNPAALGSAGPGDSTSWSRGNHVHAMPSAANVGADPAGTAAGAVSAHAALTTGVHGAGESTLATAANITSHANTTTGVHGLGTMSQQASNNVSITGGSITGITDLAIADGGTGASTAAGARANLGLGDLATANAGDGLAVGVEGQTDETVALFHAEGDDGSTTLTDATGNHTASAVGSAEIDDAQKKFGSTSLYLPGVDGASRVDLADHVDFEFDAEFGIDFWVRHDTSLPAALCWMGKCYNNNTTSPWFFEASATAAHFYTYASGNFQGAGGAVTINADTWYHVLATRGDDGVIRLYIDGVQIGTYSNGATIGQNADPVNIGSRYITGDPIGAGYAARPWAGWIDEIRVQKGYCPVQESNDPLYIASGVLADGFTPPVRAYGDQDLARVVVDNVTIEVNSSNELEVVTVPDHDHTGDAGDGGQLALASISDAGTIASQAADSVDIDGGAIDGATIGANSAGAITGSSFRGPIVEDYAEGSSTSADTTQSESYVDMDDMACEITVTGNALVILTAYVQLFTDNGSRSILCQFYDGSSDVGMVGGGAMGTNRWEVTISHLYAMTTGSKTFKLRWLVNAAAYTASAGRRFMTAVAFPRA